MGNTTARYAANPNSYAMIEAVEGGVFRSTMPAPAGSASITLRHTRPGLLPSSPTPRMNTVYVLANATVNQLMAVTFWKSRCLTATPDLWINPQHRNGWSMAWRSECQL
jgi:hypothetical protein